MREKTQKGYTPGANSTPYAGTDNAQHSTGILPQLLNPVDEAQVERLLADPVHWMQTGTKTSAPVTKLRKFIAY